MTTYSIPIQQSNYLFKFNKADMDYYEKQCVSGFAKHCADGSDMYFGRWKDCVQEVYRKNWRTPKELEDMGYTGYKRGERIMAMVQF